MGLIPFFKIKMQKPVFSYVIFFLIFLNFSSLTWAALCSRPLYADGVYFYFWVLESKNFYWHHFFYRFLVAVLQLPSVIVLNLFPTTDTNWISTMLLNIMMSLHPMVSLFFSYKILKHYKKLSYFVFPVMSYALTCASLMGYASVALPEAMSVFWPFFLLLVFRKNNTAWEMPVIFICILGLFFSYEISILFFCISFLYLLLKDKYWKNAFPSDRILSFLMLFGIAFMQWRILTAEKFTTVRFTDSLKSEFIKFDFYRIAGFGIAGMVLGISILFLKSKDIKNGFFWCCLTALLILFFSFFYMLFNINTINTLYLYVYYQRTTAGAVAVIFALAIIVFQFSKTVDLSQAKNILTWLKIAACLSLIISFTQDVTTNYSWLNFFKKLELLSKNSEGCNVFSTETERSYFTPFDISNSWFMPMLTMRIDYSLKPKSVFYVEDPPTGEACQVKDKHFGNMSGYFDQTLKRFDFSAILSGPIRIHTWDPESKTLKVKLVPRMQ